MPTQLWASWDYTIFAAEGEGPDALDVWIEKLVDFTCVNAHVASIEICPKSKRYHLQGRITFKRGYSFAAMKKIFGDHPHIEGTKCALDDNYMRKLEADKVIDIDNRKKKGERTDLENMRDLVKETSSMRQVVNTCKTYQGVRMAEKWLEYCEPERNIDPSDIQIHWRWGPSGCNKTRAIWEKHGKSNVFQPTTYKWWVGYDGHKIVLIDDFRPSWCTFSELLKLLDIYPYRVETKGGARQIQATLWYITSCYPPEDVYPPETFDRYNSIEQLTRRLTTVTRIGKRGALDMQAPAPEMPFGGWSF